MGYSSMLAGLGFDQKRNSIKDVISYLKRNPFQTESEINENVWNYDRNSTWVSNKKYAEIIRRGLQTKKIFRAEYRKGRSKYVYFVIPESVK